MMSAEEDFDITLCSKTIDFDVRWKHPFTCVIAGPTSCGKTHFVMRLLQSAENAIQPPPRRMFWFYGEWQATYAQNKINNLQYIEGLPEDDVLDPTIPNLIVIDDLLSETDSKVTKLFTKGSHHKNCSVIYITQNLFDKNRENRTITLNSHYMILFKSPRDAMQVQNLARQMYPGKTHFMREAFEDATKEPYTYLMVDLKPNTPECLRLRANVLPGEMQVVYIKR